MLHRRATEASELRVAPADVEPFGDKDIRALPNELLVMIAHHLEPGSRSLLNLVRSCRDLYGLLLARLYKSFSSAYFYRSFDATSADFPGWFNVPLGAMHIESLDLIPGCDCEAGRGAQVLRSAGANLAELSCKWSIMEFVTFNDRGFPKLRKLTVLL